MLLPASYPSAASPRRGRRRSTRRVVRASTEAAGAVIKLEPKTSLRVRGRGSSSPDSAARDARCSGAADVGPPSRSEEVALLQEVSAPPICITEPPPDLCRLCVASSVGRGFMACPAAAPRPHHHPPAQHNLRGGEQGKGDGWSRREEGRRGCARPYAEIAWRSRREEGRRRWWWWSESGEGERRHWRGRRRRWWWQLRWGRLQCPSRMCVGRAAHT
jgi:hypothetical protein